MKTRDGKAITIGSTLRYKRTGHRGLILCKVTDLSERSNRVTIELLEEVVYEGTAGRRTLRTTVVHPHSLFAVQ